jgi:DNA polymerase/3'-5' exonuclease PolX
MSTNKDAIITYLTTLMDAEKLNKQPFKVRAYRNAIDTINTLENIEDANSIKGLPGIGVKIYDKINDYFISGKIKEVNTVPINDKVILQNQLLNIYGIGPTKAKELLSKIKTFDELYLEKNQELLNSKQKIGLAYYDDLLEKIPYKEAEEHNIYINSILKNMKVTEYHMVGSFRRKKDMVGDIDILIKDTPCFDLKKFITKMVDDKYILESLASGKNKFMGICKIGDNVARRIDILVADSNYYFALLYFTGSYQFNITMRNKALEMGYSLSEYGLKDKKTNKLLDDINNTVKNEKDIFKILDMKYIKPENRI